MSETAPKEPVRLMANPSARVSYAPRAARVKVLDKPKAPPHPARALLAGIECLYVVTLSNEDGRPMAEAPRQHLSTPGPSSPPLTILFFGKSSELLKDSDESWMKTGGEEVSDRGPVRLSILACSTPGWPADACRTWKRKELPRDDGIPRNQA